MGSIFKNAALAVTAFLAVSANCHMVMKSPVPYGKSTLNNSPLDASGSDFPCKLRPGAFDPEGAQNIMAIGEPQTLSFTGSAVHGGGSCQVALTTDLQPTKDSKWMVIKSIEGGCPANTAGNLPADPNGSGASTFQYTIPEGITPGQFTIAWSWINKVGNREFYMNCGPATVVAAKKKRYAPAPKVSKRETSFPDLFVANLASINDCKTPESFDYAYPNPGADVEKAGAGPYTTLSCGAAGGNTTPQQPTGVPGGGSGSAAAAPTIAPNGGNPGQYTASGAATAAAGQPSSFAGGNPAASLSGNASSGAPGIFASGASSSPTLAVVPVTPPTSAVPVATQTASPVTGAGSSNATGAQSGACTDEGAWACSATGDAFSRCASGQWSVYIAMPSGENCVPGIADNLNVVAGKTKRHTHGHLRRMANFLGESLH